MLHAEQCAAEVASKNKSRDIVIMDDCQTVVDSGDTASEEARNAKRQ